uniref:PAZ domain-containing protein n=1 Tax=Globodera rostochiensis TaxID=31243 RepID=A0A914H784_GLORO
MDAIHYGAWVVQPASQTPPATTGVEKGNKIGDCVDAINSNNINNTTTTTMPATSTRRRQRPKMSSLLASSSTKVEQKNRLLSEKQQGLNQKRRKTGNQPHPATAAASSTREHAPLLFIDDDDDDDDDDEDVVEDGGEEEMEWERAKTKVTANKSGTTEGQTSVNLPLIDYLCAYNNSCTLKELDALFRCAPARRRMLVQLQQHCNLRTAHLRPSERNIVLHAHDFSALNGDKTFACGGYLGLTVRQYYFAKHSIRLKHAHLPTLIEFGGGTHASYYPLECVHVVLSASAAGGAGGSGGCANAAINDITNGSGHRWRVARRTHAPPSAGGSFCWPPGLTSSAAAAAATPDDGHRCCCAACRR